MALYYDPAIVDTDGPDETPLTLMESGAIVEGLKWLVDKNLGSLDGEAHAHFFER